MLLSLPVKTLPEFVNISTIKVIDSSNGRDTIVASAVPLLPHPVWTSLSISVAYVDFKLNHSQNLDRPFFSRQQGRQESWFVNTCPDFIINSSWTSLPTTQNSGITRGQRGRLSRVQHFGDATLSSECYVIIAKYKMLVDANNYDLQNVECQRLLPSCEISARSSRLTKRAIMNLVTL